jgi:hypothetical protein
MAEEYVKIGGTSVLSPSHAWHEVRAASSPQAAGLSMVHVITGVTMGGAEMMLFRLLAR